MDIRIIPVLNTGIIKALISAPAPPLLSTLFPALFPAFFLALFVLNGQAPAQSKKIPGPRPPPGYVEKGALQKGNLAPLFKLKSQDGKSETDLAAFRGKRPVILIFGSYT